MNSNTRIVTIFLRLLSGEVLSKQALADQYAVSSETIQRDLATIKYALMENQNPEGMRLTNPARGHYQLELGHTTTYTTVQRLMMIEILLASRATTKPEMMALIEPLCEGESFKQLSQLTKSDSDHYLGVPADPLTPQFELVLRAIQQHLEVQFDYERNGQSATLIRQPHGIYFADLYFYMMTDNQRGYDDVDITKAVKFRINKLQHLKLLSRAESSSRLHHFEGGELRNQTPLPFLGNPITLEIEYYADQSYVLDRFPKAVAGEKLDHGQRFTIPANDGYGVKMWLIQQGRLVKVISPLSIRDYVIEEMQQTLKLYDV
ncbi:helix-turn-helix transcriptional regulator [Lacticaseibacillus brantae]|uniref:Transcriptional regulator n=1 Tax=Lacticaseibacillus brantae DSM 23927 TaxID=1423727 RepID=A0A0R2AY12_9LACO|nr:WYL domain-containing protein [Lacticaseibacillus brantae]KRM72237.1 transcriptional regulator [Lacticaseibacillus brantae DSM 23927]